MYLLCFRSVSLDIYAKMTKCTLQISLLYLILDQMMCCSIHPLLLIKGKCTQWKKTPKRYFLSLIRHACTRCEMFVRIFLYFIVEPTFLLKFSSINIINKRKKEYFRRTYDPYSETLCSHKELLNVLKYTFLDYL